MSESPASLDDEFEAWDDVRVSSLARDMKESLRVWPYLKRCKVLLRETAFTPRVRLPTAKHALTGNMRTRIWMRTE
jgi:hypothetical protein